MTAALRLDSLWRPSRRGIIGGMAAVAATAARSQALGSGGNGSIVIPFPPGTLADLSARKFASYLSSVTGASYVVDNLTGGAGIIAARQVLRRPADGRTLLWANSALICNAPLFANPPLEFDPAVDFVPVCTISRTPLVMFGGKDFPAGNLAELQRFGKAQKEPLTYSGFEIGSANQVAAEVLFQRLGIQGKFIPYRSQQQAYIDIAEGRVHLGVYGYNAVAPMHRSGLVKMLATLSDTPLPNAPEVPTVLAQGQGSFEISGWFALLAPKATPQAVVSELERHMRTALETKDYQQLMADTGQAPAFRSQRETRVFIEQEIDRYKTTLRALKLI